MRPCDRCHLIAHQKAAVLIGAKAYGFCSVACFVLWTRAKWMEAA